MDQFNGPIVLVAGADEAFARPMAVTLFSALRHLDPSRDVLLFVFGANISEALRSRIEAVVDRAHPAVQLTWCQAGREIYSLKTSERYSAATYLRLWIPQVLPSSLGRAIWLDSDMVVTSDLAELWSTDLRGHPVAAVENFSQPTLGTAWPRLCKQFDLPPEAGYFNSGLLLMDLDQWRSKQVAERALSFIQRLQGSLGFPDQDALNLVLSGDWHPLDPKWNVQFDTLSWFGHGGLPAGTRKALQEQLLARASILHYTGPRKPWHLRYRGCHAEAYFQALRKSGLLSAPAFHSWITIRQSSQFGYRHLAAAKRLVLALLGT